MRSRRLDNHDKTVNKLQKRLLYSEQQFAWTSLLRLCQKIKDEMLWKNIENIPSVIEC